jgi:Ca-activated chloride channel family protein
MKRTSVFVTFALALLTLLSFQPSSSAQAPESPVQITSPHGRIETSGPLRLVAQVRAEYVENVSAVRFFVDDALVGEDTEGPIYAVQWTDKNPFVPATIRVEAVGMDGVVGTDAVTLPGLDIKDEAEVASVLLDISVLDEEGQYVRGLTSEHFQVFEDDQTQTIDLVDAATVPTTHTLLVDTSNSMSYRFEFVRRAARRLASSMKPGDQMVVLPFASSLGPMTGPTADLNAVASAIETMKSGGGTAIADAILSASDVMENVDGRHIFVLFTDGYDEHSNAKLEQAMDAVRRLHGTLYTVGINGAAGMSIKGREGLKNLAAGTGGKAFFPTRDEELPVIHDRVASDVASRYLLTYTPTNQQRDGKWRAIRVSTGNPALSVKTREGYFSAEPPPVRPTLEFVARDSNRRPIEINPSDLIVVEDGVEQRVTTFQEVVAPVSMVMALDKSGSMRQEEEFVRSAAASFIDSLRPEDALGVLGFSDGADWLADIAPYRTWSRHAVSQYKTSGGTALYDGLGLALERLAPVKGRRAIVLLSDGKDEDAPGRGPGSKLTANDIFEQLAKTDVAIYAIGLGKGIDRPFLEKLAAMTNGEAYFPSDVTMLAADYKRVVEDLRRRYIVGYTSTNSTRDGKWRNVELKSRVDGLVIASRGGYDAPSK